MRRALPIGITMYLRNYADSDIYLIKSDFDYKLNHSLMFSDHKRQQKLGQSRIALKKRFRTSITKR